MQNSVWNNTIKLYTIIYYKFLLFWTYTHFIIKIPSWWLGVEKSIYRKNIIT